jgi:hypothetical protein
VASLLEKLRIKFKNYQFCNISCTGWIESSREITHSSNLPQPSLEFHPIQQTFRLEFIGGKQHIHFALMVPVVRQRRKNLPKRQLRMLLQQFRRVQTPLEMIPHQELHLELGRLKHGHSMTVADVFVPVAVGVESI